MWAHSFEIKESKLVRDDEDTEMQIQANGCSKNISLIHFSARLLDHRCGQVRWNLYGKDTCKLESRSGFLIVKEIEYFK